MIKDSTKSDLAKLKSLGSSHSGVHHWWHQRLTAIFLIFFTIWLFIFCTQIGSQKELSSILGIIQKPQNVLMLSLLSVLIFYHSFLGMQVVIEDYITCRALKMTLIISIQFFSVVTASAFVVAAIYTMTL
jgi:succinate dehydrogenase / fumarate reductase membrane anchor subunit